MSQPCLLTIVLNYRTAPMTIRAVEAALRETADLPAELVIVDNASGDGSYEALCQAALDKDWAARGVRVIQSGRNGGFGAGNNVGIRAGLADGSKPDFVYILNSDAFPDPGSVQALYDTLVAQPDMGLAGSFIHGPDGAPHITAFRFPSILSELEGAARFGPLSRLLRSRAVPMPLPEATGPVDWLAGASVMIRQDVLDQVGVFDETFFLYFEETDLCLRAARAGWPTIYVRDSAVTHIGSVSTGMKTWSRMPDYWFASRLHYFRKNHGAGYAALATLAHVAGGMFHRLRQRLQGKPPADPPHFLRDLIRHSFADFRRRLSTRSRVSRRIHPSDRSVP